MSFLDDETATTGQISLGTRRATLKSLLPSRLRQAAQQQQAPGYDILPSTMQPIPGVVSTPTDIAQVGVGQQLEQQGTTAAQVPNVFERYAEIETGAAPIGDFRRYLYPTSPAPEDEEQNDLPKATNEQFAENFGFDPYDPETSEGMEASAGRLNSLYSGLNLGAKTIVGLEAKTLGGFGIASLAKGLIDTIQGKPDFESQIVNQIFEQAKEGKLTDTEGNKVSEDDVWSYYAAGPQALPVGGGSGIAAIVGGAGRGGVQAAATGPAPATQSAYPPVDPSADLSVGDDGGDGGGAQESAYPSVDPSADLSVGDGGDGGTGFGSGGIEAAAAAGVFASGGIVTKSKTKNKTSFMSMKGK